MTRVFTYPKPSIGDFYRGYFLGTCPNSNFKNKQVRIGFTTELPGVANTSHTLKTNLRFVI